jgi:HAE1 family hydrophobic/amphiphilic exporter-1
MSLSDFSVRRSVTASMIILIILIFGIASFSRLPIDLLPDLTFPFVTIVTKYEGVGPEEIEESLTELIEGAVNTISGVKKISSISKREFSIVSVEFEWGTDMDIAPVEIREKIDQIPDYFWPDEADKPIIAKFNPSDIPVMMLSFSGGGYDVHQLKKIADDYIKDQLTAIDGVASVSVYSGSEREILVAVDQEKLSGYGLALDQVLNTLNRENLNISAGNIKVGQKDYLVRALGEVTQVNQLGEIVLAVKNQAPIRLRDIAEIYDTYAETKVYSRHNKQPGGMIVILKQTGVNPVQLSRRVWKKIHQIRQHLPPGVTLSKHFDQADYINMAIGNVRSNMIQGGILALLVIFFFLRQVRPTLIISVSIPFSILATFIPIYFTGLTINMMTIGGIVLAVGMLVDNSIVVLENIFRHIKEEGEDRITAAREGTDEVSMAITASTLTSIMVFVPIVFTTGISARIFRELALTVAYSLMMSLVIALTLIPMLSSKLLNPQVIQSGQDRWLKPVIRAYQRILSWVLDHKKLTLGGSTVVLLGSILLIIPIGKEFMPLADSPAFMIEIETPIGTKLEETDRVARQIENIILQRPELEREHTVVGIARGAGMGTSTFDGKRAMFMCRLIDRKDRTKDTEEIVNELREKIIRIPGIEKFNFVNLQTHSLGGAGNKPVEVNIFGKDLFILTQLSHLIAEKVREVEGAYDVEEVFTMGDPELQVNFDRDKMSQFGLTVRQVGYILDTAIDGEVASRYKDKGDEIDIRVRLRKKDRDSIADLENIMLTTPFGSQVYLRDIAQVKKSAGPSKIFREGQKRVASINANISGKDLAWVIGRIKDKLAEIKLPPGYFIEYGGSYKNMIESFLSLSLAFLLAVILVYMVMAAQFESLIHPLIIMFAVPYGLIGVLWVLFLTHTYFSVPAFIGVIVVLGVVVNNGIVLVDYINRLRSKGLPFRDAIIKGGSTRLRPILMTTITTLLGILPMALMGGEGSEMKQPLGRAVFGGLFCGTLLTLFIMPTIYALLDPWAQWIRSKILWYLHQEKD